MHSIPNSMSQQRPPSTSQSVDQHGVLDPRLGSTLSTPIGNSHSYDTNSRHHLQTRPPPHTGVVASPASRTESTKSGDGISISYTGNEQQTAQPYFTFPSPPSRGTPNHRGSLSTAASASNPSPVGAYPADHANGREAIDPEIDDDGDGDGENQNGDDPRRPRACEACRGLKVRCDQDPAHPELPCRRCAKAGRQCIITQPIRKRQKKSDSRVAELEKKLDALTAALHQQQHVPNVFAPPPRQTSPSYGPQSFSAPVSMPAQKRRRTEDGDTTVSVSATANYSSSDTLPDGAMITQSTAALQKRREAQGIADAQEYTELVQRISQRLIDRIRNLVRPEAADSIFIQFTQHMSPHLPAVVFPPGTTAEQVLKSRPILFACILSTAWTGITTVEVGTAICQEAIGAIADSIVRNGIKTLELIQAIQVLTLWYRPPEVSAQTNFYQLVHMASVMALDIGLGRRFNPAKARRGFGGPLANYAPGPIRAVAQDSDTLEARRAWLTCYYMCASASMVFRRPNLIRWTNYMKECIEVLETHPDAYPSDKLLCQHVKIQHICEEIGLQFLMDDSTASISITDPKVTYALNVLETQLKSWRDNVPPECQHHKTLLFFEQVTSLYLHEIALHFNHNVEDFRMPFTEESLKSRTITSDTLTQNQMAALEACLKAAHGTLDTMLLFDLQTLKTLPMLLYFVRCVYALVILIKMDLAVVAPKSELGKMMKSDDIRTKYYLDRMMTLFAEVTRDVRAFRPNSKVLRIIGKLRDWFCQYKTSLTNPQNNNETANPAYNQTPLHLLSQVATDKQNGEKPEQQDWTFDSTTPLSYARVQPTLPGQQLQQPGPSAGQDLSAYDGTNLVGDMSNLENGWGTGFEQAMDMALGSMDGLPGGALDDWFLGDSMAPFTFNYVEMPSTQAVARPADTTTWS